MKAEKITRLDAEELYERINSLPSGSITRKKRNGKTYIYLNKKQNGKVKTTYVGPEETTDLETLERELKERKQLEQMLKELVKEGEKTMNRPEKQKNGFTGMNVNVSEDIVFHPDLVKMGKRDCYGELQEFLKHKNNVHLCGLFGLRRTGKSILMQQAAKDLLSKGIPCAYIICDDQHSVFDLKQEIDLLNEQGIRYVFVDEVAFLEDFMDSAHLLSDGISSDVRIVLSATASLQLKLASQDKLYDRIKIIPTTYITFGEFSRLTEYDHIDDYLRRGGAFSEMGEGFTFSNYDSASEYVSSSIVDNIIQTLIKQNRIVSAEDYYNQSFTYNEAIRKVVAMQTHSFVKSVLNSELKFSFAGVANNKGPLSSRRVKEAIQPELRRQLGMFADNKNDFDDHFVKMIQEMLETMDVIHKDERFVVGDEWFDRDLNQQQYLFSQPGFLYQQAYHEMLVLLEQPEFRELDFMQKRDMINRMDHQFLGLSLEEVIRFDLIKYCEKNDPEAIVCKLTDTLGQNEVDVAVIHKDNKIDLYEVKHRADITGENGIWPHSHLVNKEFLKKLTHYFEIGTRAVLYTGENKIYEDPDHGESIKYINAADFLITHDSELNLNHKIKRSTKMVALDEKMAKEVHQAKVKRNKKFDEPE